MNGVRSQLWRTPVLAHLTKRYEADRASLLLRIELMECGHFGIRDDLTNEITQQCISQAKRNIAVLDRILASLHRSQNVSDHFGRALHQGAL